MREGEEKWELDERYKSGEELSLRLSPLSYCDWRGCLELRPPWSVLSRLGGGGEGPRDAQVPARGAGAQLGRDGTKRHGSPLSRLPI